jgi:hypothetical protein
MHGLASTRFKDARKGGEKKKKKINNNAGSHSRGL